MIRHPLYYLLPLSLSLFHCFSSRFRVSPFPSSPFFSLSSLVSRTWCHCDRVARVGAIPAAIIVGWIAGRGDEQKANFSHFSRGSFGDGSRRDRRQRGATRSPRRRRGCSLIVAIVRCRFRPGIFCQRDEALLARCGHVARGGHVVYRR